MKTFDPLAIDTTTLDGYMRGSTYRPSLHVDPQLDVDYGYKLIDTRVITKKRAVVFELTYPLTGKWSFAATSKSGWTVKRVVTKLQKLYAKVYRDAKKYGIWGHYITDLVIESIEYEDGKFTFGIGS